MAHGSQEIEIKLALADAAAGRKLLRGGGFRVSRARVFEANTVFDTDDLTLRNTGRLLRIREAGRIVTLTYKGVALPGRHKQREEVESEIPDAAAMALIFERLGYKPVFRYEKYRTEFRERGAGGGTAMLDETPIGVFLELEGAPRWIDRTARRLGFAEAAYVTASYGRLYFEWCQASGETPGHMVFRG